MMRWASWTIAPNQRGAGFLAVNMTVSAWLAACGAEAVPEAPKDALPAEKTESSVPIDDAPRTINLDELRLSYIADFNERFSVSSWGCVTEWIAHTPWRGDFGDAAFADPSKDFPFSIDGGALVIEARRFQDGRWMSGMLSGRNTCNAGWSQLYGYFEIRAKLPEAPGFWPAFWLIGVNPVTEAGTAEIDVFEYYSAHPDGFTLSVIKHPGVVDKAKRVFGHRHTVEPGLLSSTFNIYGVEIDAKETTFYFNREEIFSTPTEPEFRQPMYMLVSLAAIKADMTEATPDSVTMQVDYIHAYQRHINE
jgi:Glycosyl hydrolases family 16